MCFNVLVQIAQIPYLWHLWWGRKIQTRKKGKFNLSGFLLRYLITSSSSQKKLNKLLGQIRYLCVLTDYIFNRPRVAGAVLQTPPSLIQRPFSSRSSEHHYTQTVRARELKFWVSGVTRNVSPFFFFFLAKVVGLVSGGSFINGAYPV